MADVTVAAIDEMEPIYDGLARRARATLGVMVFAVEGERIAGIVGFPRQPELFTRLGLRGERRD